MKTIKTKGKGKMRLFLLCFLNIMTCTLGVFVVCGLAVELCYGACFRLMGRRVGGLYWRVTSCLGVPIHELGHAIMCPLFAHRIEHVRLWPTRKGNAMVEHSYNRRNPYAVFGNLWIGLGPIFLGLAVIYLALLWTFPLSMQSYQAAVGAGLAHQVSFHQVLAHAADFLTGVLTEQTRPLGVRLAVLLVLFSISLHVRLSAADVRGMLSGLPMLALLTALVALVFTLLGEAATSALLLLLRQAAVLTVSLFFLIFLSSLAQLLIFLLCRLVWLAFAPRTK